MQLQCKDPDLYTARRDGKKWHKDACKIARWITFDHVKALSGETILCTKTRHIFRNRSHLLYGEVNSKPQLQLLPEPDKLLQAGIQRVRANFASQVKKGRLTDSKLEALMKKLHGTLTYDNFKSVDMVRSAFELSLRKQVRFCPWNLGAQEAIAKAVVNDGLKLQRTAKKQKRQTAAMAESSAGD